MNVDLLLQAADRITKKPIGFDMQFWGFESDNPKLYEDTAVNHAKAIKDRGCRTVCCIAGTIARLIGKGDSVVRTDAEDAVGVDCSRLFYTMEWPDRLRHPEWHLLTPQEQADHAAMVIHDFIRTNGWQDEPTNEPKDNQ